MMNNQEIPQGYKRTKVGVIPKEWDAIKLEKLFTFKNGINASKEQYGSGVKFINVLDIINNLAINHHNIIGLVSITEKELKLYEVKYGDILFQRSSETREEVGQSNVYLDKNETAVFGGFVIKGTPKQKYNPLYMNYLLKIQIVRNQITSRSGGSTRYNIGQKSLEQVIIPFPPLEEQQKIAEILTTWDSAISVQVELIKVKVQLKKGLMQKLLSGEVRFDEFSDDWEETPLKEVLSERKKYSEKGLNFEHVSLTKKGVVPKSDRYERDFLVKDDNKKYKVTHLNDICYNPANLKFGVICKNTLGTAIFSPIYITFELNKNHNIDFFGYLLTTNDFINRVRKYEQGTVYERMAVSPKDFLSYKLKLPSKQEQQKIAEVLSNTDKEIKLLKKELQELKEQKKGLMQKLLIGEVRVMA